MPAAEIPAALQEFMNHRKHISHKETAPETKKKLGLSDKKGKAEIEMALQGIIEKKPNKKIVAEFLQGRVKELSAAKMA